MIRSLGLLLTVMVAQTSAMVKKGIGLDNPAVQDRDILVYHLDDVFDVTAAKGNVTFTTTAGYIRDYRSRVANMTLDQDQHLSVNAVDFIDNQTFAAVLDSTHMYIQTVNLEGNGFGSSLDYQYIKLGANMRCDDVEIYHPTKRAYVACWNIKEATEDPGSIYILEFDLTQTANATKPRVLTVPQTDLLDVQFRIRLGLWNLTSGSTNQPYIILYDQAISASLQNFNKWFLIFDHLADGYINYRGIVSINDFYPNLRTLYDIFYFNNQLLITGKFFTDTKISMIACTYNDAVINITCSDASKKTTAIDFGYVGMTTNNQWVSYDYNTQQMKTCPVGKSFQDPSWISSDCENYMMPRFDDSFVQLVQDNWHGKMITWVYPDGMYDGITVWSRELQKSWKETQTYGILMDRHFYQVTTTEFIIRDFDYAFLVIEAEDLPEDGPNQVILTARDDESTVRLEMAIDHLPNAFAGISFDEYHHLPEVNMYGNTTFNIPIYESDFYGNNINFTTTVDGDAKGYVDATSYTTFPYKIIYDFTSAQGKSNAVTQFSEITFTTNYAVASDRYNQTLYLFNCGSTDIDSMRCVMQFSFNTPSAFTLRPIARELLGYVFSWMTDSSHTYVHMFGSSMTDSGTFRMDGVADDAHAVEVAGRVYLFVSFSANHTVYVKSWSPVNPINFVDEAPITAGTSNMPYFCPNDIFDTYRNSSGYLEIVSSCMFTDQPDQRIFRYTLPKLVMSGSHPINTQINLPQVCAINNSYIITSKAASMIEGRYQYQDDSRFYFNIHEFQPFVAIREVHCVADAEMVVAFTENANHRMNIYNLWGDSFKQGNKRVHSMVANLTAGIVRMNSYAIGVSVIHVLYDSNDNAIYYMTLAKEPIIQVKVRDIPQSPIVGMMNIKLSNGNGDSAVVYNNVTLRKMDTSLGMEKIGNKEYPKSTSNFSLEEYVNFKGHIFNATLKDERADKTDKVQLIQRAAMYTHYFATETSQTTFQHIEAHGDYTIALHKDGSNSGFFTIFRNNTIWKGILQPPVGIQAFDFGIVNDGRALLAFSTSVNSGSKLWLMLIRDNEKLFSTSTEGNYTKLRFAAIDAQRQLLFGTNSDTLKMDVILVTVSNGLVTSELVNSYDGVTDFDVTDPGTSINLFYTTDEAITLSVKSWNKNSVKSGPKYEDDIQIQGANQYWLQSVSCVNEGDSSSACIVNTISSILFEIVVANNQATGRFTKFDKFGNYDGKYLYIDEEFIAMRAVTSVAPRTYAFLLWKRPSKGGNGTLHAGIPIPGSARPGTDITSGFTPYTLIKAVGGKSMLFAGTHNPFEPLQFYEVGSFRIVTEDSGQDLRKVYLNLNSFNGVQWSAGTIADLTNDTRTGLSWWPFVVGPLLLIIIVAVIYYAYTRSKKVDPVYEKSAVENYRSMPEEIDRASAPKLQINVNTDRPSEGEMQA